MGAKLASLRPVRPRFQILLVAFLGVIATGEQWDLIQAFAWGRMVTQYARTVPLNEAVAKTFDGEMCPICQMVASARKREQSRSNMPETKVYSKILLFHQAAPDAVAGARPSVAWFPSEPAALTVGRAAPPVPPPRAALA